MVLENKEKVKNPKGVEDLSTLYTLSFRGVFDMIMRDFK